MTGVPARAAGLVTRQVGGECIIVQVRGGVADLDSIYTLNDSASWIWERIDGRLDDRQLAGALADEFDVTLDEAVTDVTRVVDELCAEGLVDRLSGDTENDLASHG